VNGGGTKYIASVPCGGFNLNLNYNHDRNYEMEGVLIKVKTDHSEKYHTLVSCI
jgi:hypothetical protein